MATLSLATPKPTPPLHNYHRSRRRYPLPSTPCRRHLLLLRPISAVPRIPSTPPTAPPGELYQPFRPPPSPLPSKYRSLDTAERLDILRNRLGLWHEYAPLISSLSRDGFTPPSIEEITGITGVEQNRLSVASQVRDSLLSHSSSFPTDLLAFFDAASGADLLYELRLLSIAQRAAAARHVVERRFDAKAAQELARAIKDFPRRRGDEGWECFSAESPGDCLAYTDYRLSREAIAEGERAAALQKAMEEAESESARSRIANVMDKRGKDGEGEEEEVVASNLPVVRLRYGEVAEAASVVLLPVCQAAGGEEELEAAPRWCRGEGEVGAVLAERGWARWVVLPGWGPAAAVGGKGGVAVEFRDGRMLPWRKGRWEKEEAVLAVVDRERKEVVEGDESGFYLVGGGEKKKGLVVERGRKLLETGRSAVLGAVVMVVRPPKEEDGQLGDENWE